MRKEGAALTVTILLSIILVSESAYGQTSPIVLKFDFPQPRITRGVLIHDNVSYDSIEMESLNKYGAPGMPIMPFKTVKILIPQDGDMQNIEVTCGNKITLDGKYRIEFGKKPVPLRPGLDWSCYVSEPNKEVYLSGAVLPDKLYLAFALQKFRGYKILIVNLYPVQYIPKDGLLSYFKDMTVKVNLKPAVKISPSFRNLPKDRAAVIKKVDNPQTVNTYTQKVTRSDRGCIADPCESYEYVIITSNELKNSSGTYTFQDLVSHKNQKGVSATIVTIEEIENDHDYDSNGVYGDCYDPNDCNDCNTFDDTSAHLRNFIKDAYENWGTEYILLGGDGDGNDVGGESGDNIIPARRFYACATDAGGTSDEIPADLYYAGLDGSWNNDEDNRWAEYPSPNEADFYAEVYAGRAPVDSDVELSNFVMKTIARENSQDPYLKKAQMVGEKLSDDPTWGGDVKDRVKDGSYGAARFPDGYDVNTLYDRDDEPNHDWDKSEIISIINNGTHLINHMGHSNVLYVMKLCNAPVYQEGPYCGTSGNTDVDNLTNDKYCFIYSMGCYPGAFDNWHSPREGLPNGGYTKSDSIGEHFVTSEHGAYAVVMNSRDGWFGLPDDSENYDRQFWDAIFGEGITNIGRANQDSKEDNIGFVGESNKMRWCYYAINLLGDPECEIWNGWDVTNWWKFDEGSGTKAFDSAGDNDGNITGASWTNDSNRGWCLDFNGNGNYVALSPINALGGTNVTISAWVNTDSTYSTRSIVYQQADPGGGMIQGYHLYLAYGKPTIKLGSYYAQWNQALSIGTWHHLAGTNDGSTLKIYVDGNEMDSQPSHGNGYKTNAYIGYNGSSLYFDGKIDDVRVYNWAMDTNEIRELLIEPNDPLRFYIRDATNETVAWFGSLGNLVLRKGSLTQNTNPTASANDEFRFQNTAGTDKMIIDTNSGNMTIKGKLNENRTSLNPPADANNFIVKDDSNNVVAYIDVADGNMYLKGQLYEKP